MGDAIDPDLAVDDGDFVAFAEAVVGAVLGTTLGTDALTGAATADEVPDGGEAADGAGSVIAGEGADALYTLPDGSVSFSGYGLDGTSYSFGVD